MSHRAQGMGFLVPIGQPARDAEREHFISAALYLPGDVVGYHVSECLADLYPQRALVETGDADFDLDDYMRAGRCVVTPRAAPHAEWLATWERADKELRTDAHNAWLEVAWQGQRLDVLVLHWADDKRYFVLADSREVAERFITAVCLWSTEVHAQVLVFDQGYWAKDHRLFAAIRGATFDNLVLRCGLKEEIVGDVTRFFAAADVYQRWGVPWKRGLLFAGPPGNGKTHAIKALVNRLDRPCLYVKSFRKKDVPDEYAMHTVFEQARLSAPCILVLEDLDALVTAHNRSFFLNEMDGFAANVGILTVATSNHPERLDPAIAQRPSRFDRTYRFDLPDAPERAAYVERWNGSVTPEMRVGAATMAQLVAQTDGFSFAYLKELLISAMMRWMDGAVPGAMDEIVAAQVGVLREQMGGTAASVAGGSGTHEHAEV